MDLDLLKHSVESQFVASDGEPIYVAVEGEGSPLVFLHGWTSSHVDWFSYADSLAESHRCYCWDARGHGGHKLQTETPVTVERMALDLRELIAHYELDKPVLLGHSMGALTIWEYIREFGCDGISRLVLVDQSPRLLTDEEWEHGIYSDFPNAVNEDFMRRLEDDFAEAVVRLVAEGNNPRAQQRYTSGADGFRKAREYLQSLSPGPLIEVWKSLTLADYREVLPLITVPTMLVHGDESHFYSLELAEYVRDRIPDALLHVYEGADHSPHLWQRERFVEDLKRFTAPSGSDLAL
jgi:non-heme chloroperoxidase